MKLLRFHPFGRAPPGAGVEAALGALPKRALIVHQAVAGEHNLDDVGDKAAPGIQMDGYRHHLFRYFNKSSALLAFVAISFSFAIAFSLRLTAQRCSLGFGPPTPRDGFD